MDKYTILLVDDEEEVIQAIIRKINWEELGFSVVGYADNGIKALEMIEESQPDVVMTDIKIPVMDVLELIEKIREQDQSTRIVLLTCYEEFSYLISVVSLFDYGSMCAVETGW